MISLTTFSDSNMSRAAELCIASAKAHGVESVRHYSPETLADWRTVRANPEVFRQPEDSRRAWGWWAFKPLILQSALGIKELGDTVIYSDAGVEFINNVRYVIDRMDQDIFLFGNNWEHAHWCKRDIVDEVTGGPYPWTCFGKQVQASVIFFRVSDYTRKFVKEWLDWCLFEGGRLIDDSPSRTPNHPEFQENRHDQAILTTLAYREGLRLHYWPAVYNKGGSPEFVYEKLPEYAGDDYPVLVNHHRKRNHEWPDQGIMAHV